MIIIEKEYNAQTGETTITEREETLEEQKAREDFLAQVAKQKAQAKAKAQARQALLDRLGITEDEAKLLLGGN